MGFKFYRGDSRQPDDIKAAKGFHAWGPLSVEQARLLIMKAQNNAVDDSAFPDTLSSALKAVSIKKTIDLQVFIKYTKNKTGTPQVSTAPDEDCGGQANGKDEKGRPFVIYEIEYDTLNVLQTGGARPATAADFPHTGMFPKVLIDKGTLATATVIALLMKDEIAFLTSIDLGHIKRSKQGGTWATM